ncbi:MAG: hypothetical protein RLZZ371_2397 [Pseudomonadota bacterium]|jgi:ABC-type nickel/cobalt efflux system permease component RcnA
MIKLFDFHKPDWLYEALPYVYVIAGIATILSLDNALSMGSGALLVSAGICIWWMRRTSRQTRKRRETDRRKADRRAADRRAAERKATDRRAADRRESDRRHH